MCYQGVGTLSLLVSACKDRPLNKQIVKMLKDNIRRVETDLSNWRIELYKRVNATNEAQNMVDMLVHQLELYQDQLEAK